MYCIKKDTILYLIVRDLLFIYVPVFLQVVHKVGNFGTMVHVDIHRNGELIIIIVLSSKTIVQGTILSFLQVSG